MTQAISKTLSPNDVGATGAHQAGMHIPKTGGVRAFFPQFDEGALNPRCAITCRDATGKEWPFTFIYYNNRLFGGTRNEYRLTGMTAFVRAFGLRAGDTVVLRRLEKYGTAIDVVKRDPAVDTADGVLQLGSEWRIVPMRKG